MVSPHTHCPVTEMDGQNLHQRLDTISRITKRMALPRLRKSDLIRKVVFIIPPLSTTKTLSFDVDRGNIEVQGFR